MALPFSVGPVVAQGTQAQIRLGRAPGHGAWLAVKQPRAGHDGAIRAEASLLPRLAHPGIVAVWATDALSATPFVATLWQRGGDLRRRIARPAPLAAIARCLAPVAAALDWLHGQGIVHGDIKPANLLLDASGRACLIDFAALGTHATLAYASPERRLGRAADPRDDVFSLAAVIWAWLTAAPPFGADPMLCLDAPLRPPGLSPAAWAGLRSGLAPARLDRPAHASALIGACLDMPCPA